MLCLGFLLVLVLELSVFCEKREEKLRRYVIAIIKISFYAFSIRNAKRSDIYYLFNVCSVKEERIKKKVLIVDLF